MTETLSTKDISVRWTDDGAMAGCQTRFFLFSEASGQLFTNISKGNPAASLETISRIGSTLKPNASVSSAISIRPPRASLVTSRGTERYILLKKYEGVVTIRDEVSFTAQLYENADDYPVLEAQFDLEELSETDRTLAQEGAALVWTIGYRYCGSTRNRESSFYFRRLPKWTEKEVLKAHTEITDLMRDIQWA